MSLMSSAAYSFFISFKILSINALSLSSILFFAMWYSGYVLLSSLTFIFLCARLERNKATPTIASRP